MHERKQTYLDTRDDSGDERALNGNAPRRKKLAFLDLLLEEQRKGADLTDQDIRFGVLWEL